MGEEKKIRFDLRTAHPQTRYIHDGDAIVGQFRSIMVNPDGSIDDPDPEWISSGRITNYGNAFDGMHVVGTPSPKPTLLQRLIGWFKGLV